LGTTITHAKKKRGTILNQRKGGKKPTRRNREKRGVGGVGKESSRSKKRNACQTYLVTAQEGGG